MKLFFFCINTILASLLVIDHIKSKYKVKVDWKETTSFEIDG